MNSFESKQKKEVQFRPHDVHAFAFCKIIQRRLEKVHSGYHAKVSSSRIKEG
jgi:hypothetical protein